MDLLQQPRADVEFLRAPGGSRGVLAQTEFGDGFLRRVEFALLLVVVEDARRRVEILGICLLLCLRFIQELSQAVRLRQQIEIALDQLRRPQRLERFFIDGEPLLKRSLPIFDERPRFYRKNLARQERCWEAGVSFSEASGGAVAAAESALISSSGCSRR